jgi:metallophosphoesterase superfamily enzyme
VVIIKNDKKTTRLVLYSLTKTKVVMPRIKDSTKGTKINLSEITISPFFHGIIGAIDIKSIRSNTLGKFTRL